MSRYDSGHSGPLATIFALSEEISRVSGGFSCACRELRLWAAVAATAHGGHVPGGGRSPRGKNETCGAAELIWPCCRANRQKRAAISRGNKMATIPMIPVGPVTTLDRSILRTERRMPGTGGDDFICGHCGYVILEDFDPSMVRGNPVYQCAYCENNNDLPFTSND